MATFHKRLTKLGKPPLLISFLWQYVNTDTLTVLRGKQFYSDGVNTYEVAVIHEKELVQLGDDTVAPYRTMKQVTEIMIECQKR